MEETRRYIRDFDRLAGTTTTARELCDKMLKLYSDRVNPGALWRPNRHPARNRRRRDVALLQQILVRHRLQLAGGRRLDGPMISSSLLVQRRLYGNYCFKRKGTVRFKEVFEQSLKPNRSSKILFKI
jgi:hypothetical protein